MISELEILHQITCKETNVDYDSTFNHNRNGFIKESRQITMYIAWTYRKKLNFYFMTGQIGMFFSNDKNKKGFDHATVLHANKVIQHLIDSNSFAFRSNIKMKTIVDNILRKYSMLFQFEGSIKNLIFNDISLNDKNILLKCLLGYSKEESNFI